MFPSLILALALMGQSNSVKPTPTIQEYAITYNGMDITVKGWTVPPDPTIHWRPLDPFNAAAITAAKRDTKAPAADPFPGGVTQRKIPPGPAYHAESPKALRFVADLSKPDTQDGGEKLHVTVIGTVDDAAPVLNDLRTAPEFANIRDRMLIQEYREGEWAVDSDLGFKCGKPTILVQASKGSSDPKGGRVLYRAMDYSMGAVKLSEDIRKADPNYKPDDDPGPANPGKPSKPDPSVKPSCPFGFDRTHKPYILAAVVGIAMIYLLPRKETVNP